MGAMYAVHVINVRGMMHVINVRGMMHVISVMDMMHMLDHPERSMAADWAWDRCRIKKVFWI